MLRAMGVIITLVVTVLSVSTYVDAESWAIRDIYGDASPLLIQPIKPIDLRFMKESSASDYREKEKTLSSDFDEFIKENLSTYAFIWVGRLLYSPGNVKAVFTTPPHKFLHNITGWQGCDGGKSRPGICSNPRRPFWKPALLDGDSFHTNFIQHPVFGAASYLYYRARGYDRTASGLASFLTSTFYEYTVEGWRQSPSFEDMIVTPGLGILLGISLEETSNWLAERDNHALRLLSYIVNPARVLIPNGNIAWQNVLTMQVAFQFNW